MNTVFKAVTFFILYCGVVNVSFSQSSTCDNPDATHYPNQKFGTTCLEALGTCWVKRSDFEVNRTFEGMVDAAPYFTLTEGGSAGWLAQCHKDDTEQLISSICDEGMEIYKGTFETPCQGEYSCWKNTSQSIVGAVDASAYSASGWQVQCQIGTTPQLGAPIEPPVVLEPPFPATPLYTSGLPQDNGERGFAWDFGWSQSGLLIDFERTRDIEHLRKFLHRAFYIVSKRDDNLSSGGDPVWSYDVTGLPLATDSLCSSAGIDGRVLTSMAEFLFLYAQKPYIFTQFMQDELLLDEVKTYFETIIAQTTDFHSTYSWNAGIGTYKMNSQCDIKESSGIRTLRDLESLPFNLAVAMGRVHFMLYKSNGEQTHLDRALAIAAHLSNYLSYTADGGLQWPYWSVDPIEQKPEDVSHAITVIDFIKMLAEHKVAFSDQHLAGLFNTIQFFVLRNTGVTRHFVGTRWDPAYTQAQALGLQNYTPPSGAPRNVSEFGKALAGWLPVIKSAGWIGYTNTYISSGGSEFDKLVTSYQNSYTRTGGESSSCSIDGQCTSDVCYAGVVCGAGPVGETSTCYRDKECASGSCGILVTEPNRRQCL